MVILLPLKTHINRNNIMKFNENIKATNNWCNVYIKNLNTGKRVGIIKTVKNNTMNIKMAKKRLTYSTYQVYIPAGAVKDNAGNTRTAAINLQFKTGK